MNHSVELRRAPQPSDRVIVGLSGGVDSAVAAALLKETGHEPYGIVLRLWQMEGPDSSGISIDAQRVAEALRIPFEIVDLRDEFYQGIVLPFARVYAEGRTPNPCVICNPTMKLAALLNAADRMGAQWIATGHYARVDREDPRMARLLTARAEAKDQSYALYRLPQSTLRRLLLPLGEMDSKARVRAIAAEMGLPAADRRDSQDLCFAAGNAYSALLEAIHPGAQSVGPIVSESGKVCGQHNGISRFTIGQRSGIGISSGGRLYVVDIDAARNAVIVGPRSSLECTSCELNDVTYCSGEAPQGPLRVAGRIRYREALTEILVTPTGERQALAAFSTPQIGVSPGQSLVFYGGDEVIGGGIIHRAHRSGS